MKHQGFFQGTVTAKVALLLKVNLHLNMTLRNICTRVQIVAYSYSFWKKTREEILQAYWLMSVDKSSMLNTSIVIFIPLWYFILACLEKLITGFFLLKGLVCVCVVSFKGLLQGTVFIAFLI